MEHCCQQVVEPNMSVMDDGAAKLKSVPTGDAVREHDSGSFDCNICLDYVQDPVVTFCGHLFCWPCIYKWIELQSSSVEDLENQPQCPVCKAEVSESTIIPLYGRGQPMKSSDGKAIPQRPMAPSFTFHKLVTATSASHPTRQPHRSSYLHGAQPYYGDIGDHATASATDTLHLGTSMFGEMMYARIFGSAHTTLFAYPESHRLGDGMGSPGLARHVMKIERSMNRVSFFLFCCVILCLLLF